MSYNDVAALAHSVQEKHDSLKDMLDGMDRLFDSTKVQWEGKACKRFSDDFKEIEADLRYICDFLEKYAKAVRKAGKDTEETDVSSAKEIESHYSF